MRALIVMPSWLGDAVMAVPAVRHVREQRPGAFLGGLVRPGIDQVLGGLDLFDELHVERARGVMGPKLVASKVRPKRYDAALLLTNSFSTALVTRLAFIPRRVGYSRDGRALLLTDRLQPPRRDGEWAVIPAVSYYWRAAGAFLDGPDGSESSPDQSIPDEITLELATTNADEKAADAILDGIDGPLALLNPGGNNEAKRWPLDRFARLADHLTEARGMRVVVSGSPGEADLVAEIARTSSAIDLTSRGITIGSLKAIVRRCRILVTNDTGPRHIAAAFGVPVVTLFGPTDHRWTTLPAGVREELVLADPDLPEGITANDEPERCRIDRITEERVRAAADRVLDRSP